MYDLYVLRARDIQGDFTMGDSRGGAESVAGDRPVAVIGAKAVQERDSILSTLHVTVDFDTRLLETELGRGLLAVVYVALNSVED